MVINIERKNIVIVLVLVFIFVGIFIIILVNFDKIVAYNQYLNSTVKYNGIITDKKHTHWTTTTNICDDDGCTPITIWHNKFEVELNNTIWVKVGVLTYNDLNVGDNITIYLSGRVEKL